MTRLSTRARRSNQGELTQLAQWSCHVALRGIERHLYNRSKPAPGMATVAAMAEACAEGMLLINRELRCEAANQAFCSSLGRLRHEIVGLPAALLWGEEVFEYDLKEALEAAFLGLEVRRRLRLSFPGAGLQLQEVDFYPRRNRRGEVTHVALVLRSPHGAN